MKQNIHKHTRAPFLFHLPRPLLIVVSALVLLIGVGSIMLVPRLIHQKNVDAFRKASQKGETASARITEETRTPPLYADKAQICYWEYQDEFSGKKLYCETEVALYFTIDQAQSEEAAARAARVLEEEFGIAVMGDSGEGAQMREGAIAYSLPVQRFSNLNNIGCGATIQYPDRVAGSTGLPSRTFSDQTTLSVSISCTKEVRTPVYDLIDI